MILIKASPHLEQVSSSSTLVLIPKVSPTSNSVDYAKGEDVSENVMINTVLFLKVLGEDEPTMGKVARGGSSTSSNSHSKGGKDAPSLHRLISSLEELNLRSVSCDRSYSHILLANPICWSFNVFVILLSLVKPSLEV